VNGFAGYPGWSSTMAILVGWSLCYLSWLGSWLAVRRDMLATIAMVSILDGWLCCAAGCAGWLAILGDG